MIHVALLRGINVGGNKKLPMKDLAGLLENLGCEEVQTYIQSGNAVFRAPAPLAAEIPASLAKAIREKFGFEVPVVLRKAADLRKVLETNPFLSMDADRSHLYVGFLKHAPEPAAVKGLDPKRSPGDSFAVLGQEVYLHLPKDVAATKLTNAYFDKALGTVCTVRNWNTVQALVELAG
jgi:uncharacterized protein (DUF1697 family)